MACLVVISSFLRPNLVCVITLRLIWDNTALTRHLKPLSMNTLVEMLYNFITSETSDFGVFAGVGLGYVIYSYDMKENALISNKEQKRQIVDISRDFDIRFVAGLRVNLAKRHGIELYSRFALMKQKEIYIITPIKSFSGGWDYITTTLTNKALISFGIGYVFSF